MHLDATGVHVRIVYATWMASVAMPSGMTSASASAPVNVENATLSVVTETVNLPKHARIAKQTVENVLRSAGTASA